MDLTAFTYHTTSRVVCDGQEFAPGSEFRHSDAAIIAELRKAGAIVLREELARPDEIAQRLAELESENGALRAELERLRQAGVTAEVAAVAAKASAASAAAASAPAKEAASKAPKAAPAAAAASDLASE